MPKNIYAQVEQRGIADLSVGEIDARVAGIEQALRSGECSTARRVMSEYALLALLQQRNTLAPAMLPAVPKGLKQDL